MDPNLRAYLESWAGELLACSNRIRQLIGDAHWLTDGYHKEALVRDFLRRYLPVSLIASRGFVKSPTSAACSPEIDILIVDPGLHPSLFAERELQIAPPSSVIAHFEIKTAFTKENLTSALSVIWETQLVVSEFSDPATVWRSICIYDVPQSRTRESILETLADAVLEQMRRRSQPGATPSQTRAVNASMLPVCVASLSRFVAFISSESNSAVTIKLFEIGPLSLACAMADLFGFVRRRYGGSVQGELDDIIEGLDTDPPIVKTLSV
jgi:uncharacterized protein DUF6602